MAERSAWRGVLDGLAGEVGRAAESVRHEVVDRAWFGRSFPEATPAPASSFEQWAGIEPATVAAPPPGDPMGRTLEATVDRPSNLHEREATAAAYARHQQAGPFGLIELEDVQTREQSGFEQWAGLPAADIGAAGIGAARSPEVETAREREPSAPDIER